jgi:hypothetical protein
MRIFIAAILGAVAMFVWTSIAHVATPLGQIGFSQIPNEGAVMSAMQSSLGDKQGLFFYPWFDAKDPNAMTKSAEMQKTLPHGLLIYNPPNVNVDANMMPMLVKEFVKQFAQALFASVIVSFMIGATFLMRWSAVVLMFASSSIAVNVSYWNWYHFPLNFTLAAIIMELVSGIAAGLAIAWWMGRGQAA